MAAISLMVWTATIFLVATGLAFFAQYQNGVAFRNQFFWKVALRAWCGFWGMLIMYLMMRG